ncbi:MAG: hypothetical protein L6Q98_14060 [Anaerolineae bacterium]|nr:hypothetical protein [Anaerolineae bacterium]NUQ03345.1 hypothetical protein [Anaerolineae bacterium]
MTSNSARRASIALGIFMAIVLIAGAIIPIFTQNQTTTTETTPPTEAPIPTFPPPPSNLTEITFDKVYLHPTGIFSIGQPDGWEASEPNKGATIAQVNLVNNEALAVVDSYVEDAGGAIQPEELSGRFTREVINASWARFNQWEEANRVFDPATQRLQIDFNITLTRQQYVARQYVWTDGRWIYVVRVLAPENATEMLRYLLDGFAASFTPNTFFQGTPLDWTAHYDSAANTVIRYPSEWQVTDSALGGPTSIASSNGVQLRLTNAAGTTVNDEDAARAFAESLRAGLTVSSVNAVEHGGVPGFAVAYTFSTVDGEGQSGLAVLLNGTDGALHVADLRFPAANIDLNAIAPDAAAETAAEATAEAPALDVTDAAQIDIYRDLARVMNTFVTVQPIPLANVEVTPTVVPTVAAPVEATAEATVEAAAEATAESAAEAEATPEATPEATEAS